MPIDIALSTNGPTGALELRQAQPMPNGRGYAALLIVRSGAFAAAVPFFSDAAAWRAFGTALVELGEGGGTSVARLEAMLGDDFIALAADAERGVAVSGILHDAEADQQLRFRFVTPSSGLATFARAVADLVAAV